MDKIVLLQVVCALVRNTLVNCEDGFWSSGADMDYDYGLPDLKDPESNLKNQISLVTKLYGNETTAEIKFWDRLQRSRAVPTLDCNISKILLIEGLKATIALNGSALTDAEKTTLSAAADDDIQYILQLRPDENSDHFCETLVERLKKSRSSLDCAMGKEEVTQNLASAFNVESPRCEEFSKEIWTKLIKLREFPAGCNATLVYSDVIRITKVMNRAIPSFGSMRLSPLAKYQEDLGGALVATISSPKHIAYLARGLCPDVGNVWDCEDIKSEISGLICNGVSIQSVLEVEELVERVPSIPFGSFEEAETPLQILEDITDIVHYMSVGGNVMPRLATMSSSGLETYMKIMDQTIGTSAKRMWSQLSTDETKYHLSRILENNEKYVWSVSRILYSSAGYRSAKQDWKKDAMALKLWESSPENSKENIAFQFDDAIIQTNLQGDGAKDQLNVYAIHYQTVAQLLENYQLYVNDSSGNETKEFVGKGGIISLSAHHQNENVSLPVTYRMNFKGSSISPDYASSVCLSCEYLDLATGEWTKTGCSVSGADDGGVTCDCNHTTNFAAFMSPVEHTYTMTDAQYKVKQIVSYVGSALSVLALTMCLIIFNVVKPSLRNERVKAHISLTFALLIVHMTQLVADFVLYFDVACLLSAIVTHYFLLAAFFWMLIEGIFLYLYVVQVFVHSSIEYLRLIYALGWIMPGIIVIISASVGIPTDAYLEMNDHEDELACRESEMLYPPIPGKGPQKYERCWLSTTSGMAYSFIVPALIIIFVNSIILGKVFQVLMRVSRKNRNNHRPFAPAPSFSSHNKVFSRNDHQGAGRVEPKSESVTSPQKSMNDSESNNGSTSPMTGKTISAEDCSQKGFELKPYDKKRSPQHYFNNPSYHRAQSPLREGDGTNKKFLGEARTALKGALVLLPILGIPWICGLWVASNYTLTMFFVVLNSTQGVFIFIVYCIMNGEVMRALRRQVTVAKLRSSTGRSRVSSTSSSKSLNSRFALSWRTKSTSDK